MKNLRLRRCSAASNHPQNILKLFSGCGPFAVDSGVLALESKSMQLTGTENNLGTTANPSPFSARLAAHDFELNPLPRIDRSLQFS